MERKNNKPERRASPRYGTRLPLKISSNEYDLIADTKNISCSGICCEVRDYIPVMTKLKLIMYLPVIIHKEKIEKKITCHVISVRIYPEQAQRSISQYAVGLFFTDIKEDDRKFIKIYIDQSFHWGNN